MTHRAIIVALAIATATPAAAASDEPISAADAKILVTASYVCGSERMKAILHKTTAPMNSDATEFCATVRSHAASETKLWKWMFEADVPATKGDPIIK